MTTLVDYMAKPEIKLRHLDSLWQPHLKHVLVVVTSSFDASEAGNVEKLKVGSLSVGRKGNLK